MVTENIAAGRRLAVAESCTGGLVSSALTEVAGSSAVFDRGFVTYSNEAKQQLLGVSEDIIETFGAVSVACAWAMAQGVLKRSNADVAVSVSGIAGPDGGTPQKPVGLVVFAKAERGSTTVIAEERQLRRVRPRRCPPSGDADRAGIAAAVKRCSSRFESRDHLAEGAIDILPGDFLEQRVAKAEIH